MQDDFEEFADEIEHGLNDVFQSFGFYSVPDLTDEEKKPPEFIVEGMIPVGMTFLSGAPKTRKSFFALQIAIAVATGQNFFGRKTLKCDVVYFDLEGSKSRIATRTKSMSTAIPNNVYITNHVEEKLSSGLVEKMRDLHRQMPQIRLMIVDTYSRARGNYRGGNANAYDMDVSFLEPIQRMAIDEGIAILFIHHDKKGASLMSDSFERLSGTMGISGSADCVMNLVSEGDRTQCRATLEVTPRDAAGSKLTLVFDNYYGEWHEVADPSADLMGSPVCKWLVERLELPVNDGGVEPRKEGRFYNYDTVFTEAYGASSERAAETVREQIKKYRKDLFDLYSVGIQLGVLSHNRRGIRVINLK